MCIRDSLEVAPPVSEHPLVELGDLGGAARLHEEPAHTGRGPVVEVVQSERMPHLVQQDVDVVTVERADVVLAADALAPVTTGTAAEPGGQPQRHVVVPRRAAGALRVVAVLVEEPAALGCALGRVLVDVVDVDVNGVVRPLQSVAVPHRPADHPDRHAGVGPGVVSLAVLGHRRHPLGELPGQGRVDLVAQRGGDRRAGVPAHAVVDAAPVGHHLVPTVVAEAVEVGVGGFHVLPDLVERGHQGTRRVPGGQRCRTGGGGRLAGGGSGGRGGRGGGRDRAHQRGGECGEEGAAESSSAHSLPPGEPAGVIANSPSWQHHHERVVTRDEFDRVIRARMP